jgi:uncharacterized membrane protein
MNLARLLKHLLLPDWWRRRVFSAADLAAVGQAIATSETRHRGELRFVVEAGLPTAALWRDVAPRQRAAELFASERVWDTEENSGILIYVQLVDRCVEILADRGIAARVPQAEWDAICRAMEQALGAGRWREGALAAVARASELLVVHFPAGEANPNELPDAPLML